MISVGFVLLAFSTLLNFPQPSATDELSNLTDATNFLSISSGENANEVNVTEDEYPYDTFIVLQKAGNRQLPTGSYRPCLSTRDCNADLREVCNKQYMELISPPCPRGYCQCEPGYNYDANSYESCKNSCQMYNLGDACGVYPTRLLPDNAVCINNTVVCPGSRYCPTKGENRKKGYGETCKNYLDCNHYSLSCLPERPLRAGDRTSPPKRICRCDTHFYYNPELKKCQRYHLGALCNSTLKDKCGSDAEIYGTGLECVRDSCICAKGHTKVVEITVPAVRIGVPDSEAFLELFDTVQICAPRLALTHLQPGSACNIMRMTGLCEQGSFCMHCRDGCPQPICRALRRSKFNSDAFLAAISPAAEDTYCGGRFAGMSSAAQKIYHTNHLLTLVFVVALIRSFAGNFP